MAPSLLGAILLPLALSGCGGASGTTDGGADGGGGDPCAKALKFSEIKSKIFGDPPKTGGSCVFASTCHNPNNKDGALDLQTDPHKALVNVPPDPAGASGRKWTPPAGMKRVVPNDDKNSFLMVKVTMPVAMDPMLGARMPNTGQTLDADSIAQLRCWIKRGAPND
jgi:hypothetical protein